MTLEFLSCVQTALLSACYDNIILKAKQIICLESLYLKKRFARLPTNRIQKVSLDLLVQNQLSVNLHTQHLQFMKRKRFCSVLRLFATLVNLSAGARYTK